MQMFDGVNCQSLGRGSTATNTDTTRRAAAFAAREAYVATNYNMYRITEHIPANCDTRTRTSAGTYTHTTPVTGTPLIEICDKRVSTDILGALTSPSSSLRFLDKLCYNSLAMVTTAQNNDKSCSSGSGSAAQKRSSSAFNSVKSKFESQTNPNNSHAPSSSALKKTPAKTAKHTGDSTIGNKGINSAVSPRDTATSTLTNKASEDSRRRQSISSPRSVGAASASTSTSITSPKDAQKPVPISRRGSTSTSTSSTSKEKQSSAEPPAITATAFQSLKSYVSGAVLACLSNREKLDLLLSNR